MAGRLFTSEPVTEGHPDKMADQISDTVLDYLENDADKENLRVAVETLLITGLLVVAGRAGCCDGPGGPVAVQGVTRPLSRDLKQQTRGRLEHP